MARRLPALLGSCLLLSTGTVRADLSAETRAKIIAGFPAWHPNPTEASASAPRTEAPAPLSNDPLVLLPNYHVQDSPLLRAGDKLRSEREVQAKAMAAYKDSMTDLEWAMNSWYIPIISAPASARARAYYEDKQATDEARRLQRLQSINAPGG